MGRQAQGAYHTVRFDHTKALASELQQTVAMLEHIETSAAAIVKPAEHIGIMFKI